MPPRPKPQHQVNPAADYQTVGIATAMEMLKELWADHPDLGPGTQPAFLYGGAGIGKSSVINQIAEELQYDGVVMIRAAEMRPEDFTGPPFPHLDDLVSKVLERAKNPDKVRAGILGRFRERGITDLGYSKFHPPLRLLQLTKEWDEAQRAVHEALVEAGELDEPYREPGPQILFLDELPNAHPDVQATLHSLVLDRTFGVEGYRLRDNIRIVAAGNRREDGAHVYQMGAPLKTRFAQHIIIEPTFEDWEVWAVANKVHPYIIQFLKRNRRFARSAVDRKNLAYTYANFRTWVMASEVMYRNTHPELLELQLEQCVGTEAAAALVQFIARIPNMLEGREVKRGEDGVVVYEDLDAAVQAFIDQGNSAQVLLDEPPAQKTVSIATAKSMLKDLWADHPRLGPGRQAAFLYGGAGIGKSSAVNQLAEELGFDSVVMIRAAEMRPEDITGPPFPHLDDLMTKAVERAKDPDRLRAGILARLKARGITDLGYSKFHPPLRLLQLTKEWNEAQRAIHEALVEAGEASGPYREPGPQILFLDELPNAHPDIQATLHSLVLDRTFGVEGYRLRDNIRIVAAGNRREDGAHVYQMGAPLKTRFAQHILVETSIEDWIAWARQNGIHPYVIQFLQHHPTRARDEVDKKNTGYTYATFRTWVMASEILFRNRNPQLLPIQLEQCLGPAAASEFMGFLTTARQAPSAEDIANDPDGTQTFDDQPDIALVAVENMIHAAPKHIKWITPFLRYAARMKEQYRELLYPELLNQSNTMPDEVILAVLQSPYFAEVQATAARLGEIIKAGEAARQRHSKRG